jgi:hypothetical protein
MAIVKLEENIEPFLVNPIGRRIGRKRTTRRTARKTNFYINPAKRTRRRTVKKKNFYINPKRKTTRRRKSASVARNFYINPRPKRRTVRRKRNSWTGARVKHKRASKVGWSSRKVGIKGYAKSSGARYPRNPFGDELLLITNPKGGATMRRRTRKRRKVSAHVTRRRSRRANPMVATHRRRHTVRKHRRARRHYGVARRHRNPMLGGLDINQIIVGTASALANAMLPIALKADKPMTKYGIQLAAAIGGKIVLEKLFKARNGNIWLIVGLSMTVMDAFKEFVLKKVTLMTPIGPVSIPSGTPVTTHPQIAGGGQPGMGAYVDEMPGNYSLTPFNQSMAAY